MPDPKPGIRPLDRGRWQALLVAGGRPTFFCQHRHQHWEDAADCADRSRQLAIFWAAAMTPADQIEEE